MVRRETLLCGNWKSVQQQWSCVEQKRLRKNWDWTFYRVQTMLLQLQLFSGFVKVVWWIFTAEKTLLLFLFIYSWQTSSMISDSSLSVACCLDSQQKLLQYVVDGHAWSWSSWSSSSTLVKCGLIVAKWYCIIVFFIYEVFFARSLSLARVFIYRIRHTFSPYFILMKW